MTIDEELDLKKHLLKLRKNGFGPGKMPQRSLSNMCFTMPSATCTTKCTSYNECIEASGVITKTNMVKERFIVGLD